MKQLIAVAIAAIALIFFIAAAATDDWEHTTSDPKITNGAFRTCTPAGCSTYTPDCKVHSSLCDPNCGEIPQPNCNRIRGVQGFLVLALLLTAIAIIIMLVVRFGGKEAASKGVHVCLALASIFAIISFAIWLNYFNPPDGTPSSAVAPGAGIGLTIVAWLLCMVDIGVWHWATMGTA